MPFRSLAAAALVAVCLPLAAEDAPSQDVWAWSHRLELRADYRWSADESHPVQFPPGAFLRTPDPGSHVELNVADVQLDGVYGDLFAVRAKLHVQALHRRNPTSSDRKVDADELFIRFGRNPQFLERPEGTSFFVQAGKFPKMERQPVRLLESYGLAATSFNRFEDVQVLVGGTVGRSFYWRAQAANGNPLFFRDPNALAGDNGTKEQVTPGAKVKFGSGFPILYNAETEDLILSTRHVQVGEALGYRWQRADQTLGFDAIVFHYERDMADREELTGTIYGGDLDLLRLENDPGLPGLPPRGLPLNGRKKREYGTRVYSEWHNATAIAQFTRQRIAGLQREGWELEAGYRIPLAAGPLESIQPAIRYSAITNHFGPIPGFPAPTMWWDWAKYDAGVRVGLKRGVDVTLEYTQHHIDSPRQLNLREALVTVRWKV